MKKIIKIIGFLFDFRVGWNGVVENLFWLSFCCAFGCFCDGIDSVLWWDCIILNLLIWGFIAGWRILIGIVFLFWVFNEMLWYDFIGCDIVSLLGVLLVLVCIIFDMLLDLFFIILLIGFGMWFFWFGILLKFCFSVFCVNWVIWFNWDEILNMLLVFEVMVLIEVCVNWLFWIFVLGKLLVRGREIFFVVCFNCIFCRGKIGVFLVCGLEVFVGNWVIWFFWIIIVFDGLVYGVDDDDIIELVIWFCFCILWFDDVIGVFCVFEKLCCVLVEELEVNIVGV